MLWSQLAVLLTVRVSGTLGDTFIPAQALTDTGEPVVSGISPTKGGHGPRGNGDYDPITLHELHAMSSVETDPSGGTRIARDLDLESNVLRKQDGSE